jgi:hypothetical protein
MGCCPALDDAAMRDCLLSHRGFLLRHRSSISFSTSSTSSRSRSR